MVMKLLVNSIDQDDLGTYKCVSKNSLGDTDGNIKVYGKFVQHDYSCYVSRIINN